MVFPGIQVQVNLNRINKYISGVTLSTSTMVNTVDRFVKTVAVGRAMSTQCEVVSTPHTETTRSSHAGRTGQDNMKYILPQYSGPQHSG